MKKTAMKNKPVKASVREEHWRNPGPGKNDAEGWLPGPDPDPDLRKRHELLAKELKVLNGKFTAKAKKDGVYREKFTQDVHAWEKSRIGSTKGVLGFLDAEIRSARKPKAEAKKKAKAAP